MAYVAHPLPLCSNNIAEYIGVILALNLGLENDVDDLTIFSDSQLIVSQVNGEWKIKVPEFRTLRSQIWTLGMKFNSVELLWNPREDNVEADALCTEMLLQDPKPSIYNSLTEIFSKL